MNRSWVRFPQAAQIRPPGFGWAFLCALTGRAAWCARGRRPAREPSAPRASLGVVDLEARPGPATAHGRRSLALRTLRCRASKPARALWTPNVVWLVVLGFWGAPLCVVTNVVNRRCFSCGFLICCYKRRQSGGFFAENQGFWTQIDDVCNMSTRKGVQTAPV